MNESFLSYLWRGRFQGQRMMTTAHEELVILHPGEQNSDSGPDFFNARIRLGETTWAGNVEIHVLASDWYQHGHHEDPVYDRVILHVVHVADRPVFRLSGEPVPTLEIRESEAGPTWERYQSMMTARHWIPCSSQLEPGIDYGFGLWAPALAVERLEKRIKGLMTLLTQAGRDWDQAFFRYMAMGFGFRINSLPFEMLAKSIPVRIVQQLSDDRFRMEALLFGQSGLLGTELHDEYPRSLLSEYRFLRRKYGLHAIDCSLWKYLRLRPSNFPGIRISQFASFLCHTGGRIPDLPGKGALPDDLVPEACAYWDTHYLFDRLSAGRSKRMGRASADLLAINGLVPFLFLFGREKGNLDGGAEALARLEKVPGEANACTERWRTAGFPVANALQTQALLHLEQDYCARKRCLECRIGKRIING